MYYTLRYFVTSTVHHWCTHGNVTWCILLIFGIALCKPWLYQQCCIYKCHKNRSPFLSYVTAWSVLENLLAKGWKFGWNTPCCNNVFLPTYITQYLFTMLLINHSCFIHLSLQVLYLTKFFFQSKYAINANSSLAEIL